jgi:hypothetical protein
MPKAAHSATGPDCGTGFPGLIHRQRVGIPAYFARECLQGGLKKKREGGPDSGFSPESVKSVGEITNCAIPSRLQLPVHPNRTAASATQSIITILIGFYGSPPAASRTVFPRLSRLYCRFYQSIFQKPRDRRDDKAIRETRWTRKRSSDFKSRNRALLAAPATAMSGFHPAIRLGWNLRPNSSRRCRAILLR